jgi:hypothetical protein
MGNAVLGCAVWEGEDEIGYEDVGLGGGFWRWIGKIVV